MEPVRSEDDAGPRSEPGPQSAAVLEGSGVIFSEARAIAEFDGLVLSGVADVIVRIDDAVELEVEADDNIVPLIETTVTDEVLTVAIAEEGVSLQPSGDIVVRISTPQLSGIEHTGVGRVMVGAVAADALTVRFSGVGGVEVLALAADAVSVEASGVGEVSLAGRATIQTVALEETADYLGGDLESETASVRHDGFGSAELWVEGELDVVIRGGGSVSYYGSPAVSSDVSQQASLIPLGER